MVLTIAAVIAAVTVSSTIYPAISRSSSSVISAAGKLDDRIQSQISIIQATGELNSSGSWVDTNGDGDFDVFVWVKNVGTSDIVGLEQCDVYFNDGNGIALVPYQTYAGGGKPYWTYDLENGTDWTESVTVEITIHFASPLSSGQYYVKVAIPNGISDQMTFSM